MSGKTYIDRAPVLFLIIWTVVGSGQLDKSKLGVNVMEHRSVLIWSMDHITAGCWVLHAEYQDIHTEWYWCCLTTMLVSKTESYKNLWCLVELIVWSGNSDFTSVTVGLGSQILSWESLFLFWELEVLHLLLLIMPVNMVCNFLTISDLNSSNGGAKVSLWAQVKLYVGSEMTGAWCISWKTLKF